MRTCPAFAITTMDGSWPVAAWKVGFVSMWRPPGSFCRDFSTLARLLQPEYVRLSGKPHRCTHVTPLQRVNAVQFSSGSRFLASGGNDGCVRVSYRQNSPIIPPEVNLQSFLQVWDLKTQEVMQTYNISASSVTSIAFSGYKDEYIVGGSARYG